MAEQKTGASSGAVKLVIASGAVAVVLLFVIKQLNFVPAELSTGSVSMKFQGVAPAAGQASSQNTAELEKKLSELQAQLQRGSAAAVTQPASSVANTAPADGGSTPAQVRPPAGPVNIAGQWKSGRFNLLLTQSGNQLTVQVYTYGILSAVGQGVVTGENIQLEYLNSAMIPGRLSGKVTPDGSTLELNDYGRGYPEPVILTR